MPVNPSAELELRLLRATVSALREAGLLDQGAPEQEKRHSQHRAPDLQLQAMPQQ